MYSPSALADLIKDAQRRSGTYEELIDLATMAYAAGLARGNGYGYGPIDQPDAGIPVVLRNFLQDVEQRSQHWAEEVQETLDLLQRTTQANQRARELLPDKPKYWWSFSRRLLEGVSEEQALSEALDAYQRDAHYWNVLQHIKINRTLVEQET